MIVSSIVCWILVLQTRMTSAFLELFPTGQPSKIPTPSCNIQMQSFFGTSTTTDIMEDLTFETPDTTGIVEEACVDAAKNMKRIAVPASPDIAPSGYVGISYIHWPASGKSKRRKRYPPLLLLHGFDSSSLEYRRLGPQLAARGVDTYAVDILGWGFTQLSDVSDFSAHSKVQALTCFVRTVLGPSTPFVVAGASLGGAAAIELSTYNVDSKKDRDYNTCAGLILIDAQGFVDGVGPMASLPRPFAKLGVRVLKSVPLRSIANQMSYFDVKQFATEEAQVIGRLHCLRDGWSDAMVSFMKSGGFRPSSKISSITAPVLVLWGRQDGILDGNEYANKFVEELHNAQLVWIEECGHVPHLEKPKDTANAIVLFLSTLTTSEALLRSTTTSIIAETLKGSATQESFAPKYFIGGGVLGALLLEEFIKQYF